MYSISHELGVKLAGCKTVSYNQDNTELCNTHCAGLKSAVKTHEHQANEAEETIQSAARQVARCVKIQMQQ